MAELLPDTPLLSIIIPVLNEASCLDHSLTRLFAIKDVVDHCEVIVSDGGSEDDSLAIAQQYNCRIVHSQRGRAKQMNAGGQQAEGAFMLFLHADSILPDDFLHGFDENLQWGFFQLRLNGQASAFRVIEKAINLRSSASRIAGGDQGLFFKSDFFALINGFPEIPLMEDIAISKLARRQARPKIIRSRIVSSCRRWQEHGIARTVLLMWWLRFAYWAGVSPCRLHKTYYPQRDS